MVVLVLDVEFDVVFFYNVFINVKLLYWFLVIIFI